MAVSQESLSVEVVLDASGAIKGLKDLNGNFISISKAADKSSDAMNEFERAVQGIAASAKKSGDTASKAFSSVGNALQSAFIPLTTLNQGFQLASSIIRGVTQSVGGFVTAFAAAETAQLKLEQSLRFVGDRVSGTADEWDRYLDVIEKTRGADADVLKGLVATSLQIGLSEKQTKALVDASTRLAEVTGRDVSQSFEALLQSYKGNARALAVLAPELRDLTEAELQNGAAVDKILEKYKDVQSIFGGSLAGQISKTRILFDDMSESVGDAIAKAIGLDSILRGLQSTFSSVKSALDAVDFKELGNQVRITSDAFVVLGSALAAAAVYFASTRAALVALAGPAVVAAAKFAAITAGIVSLGLAADVLVRNVGQLGNLFKTLGAAIGTGFLSVISTALDLLSDLIDKVPGLAGVAAGFRLIGEQARKGASALTAMGVAASEGLDFGIGGALFEQGAKALAAFNGEAEKTDDLLKNVSDKKGARGSLTDPETLKALSEEAKRAGEAFLSLGDANARLADSLAMVNTELAMGESFSAAEKQYQATLLQIEAEKQKALAAGVSLKAADEQVAKAVALAQEIRGQTEALEVQKSVRDAMKASEDSARAALDAAYASAQAANEDLLRIGMSRSEIIDRELRIELDKLDAIEEQLRKTRELNSADIAALRIARDTAKAKAEAAKMPTPGSAEAAPGIGAAVPAVAAVGAGPVGAFMAAAEMIVAAVQKLIDFIPNIINAIGKIFSSLADLPNTILKAVTGLIGSIVKFTSEFIPNLFKAIPEIIDQILTAAFETLPDAAQKLFEQLPSLIEGLLDRIPDLVAKLVDGIVSNAPTIAINLIRALIENLPAFFKAIVLFMPRLFIAIAKGIIKGVIDGVKNIFGALKGGLKNVGQGIANGFQDGLKKLTGFKGNVFGITEDVLSGPTEQVKSLVAEAEKAGRSIWESLKAAIKQAWEWIKGIGKQIWEGLKEQTLASWEWLKSVGKAIWEGTVNAAKEAWEFIKTIGKTIWDGMVSAVSGAWEFVKSIGATLWQGVVNSVSTIWEALKEAGGKIWEGLKLLFSGKGSEAWEKFKEAGGAIWEGMKELWNQGWSTLKNLGKTIWDSFKSAWESGGNMFSKVGTAIWDAFKSAFGGLKDLMSKLDLGSLIGKLFKDPNPGKGKVEGWLGADIPFLKFSSGGLVPGRPVVMGDSQRNDTVPALVSPGEAIIPRSLMQDPAVAKLIDGILGGQRPRGFSNGLRRLASSAGAAIQSGAQAVGGAVTSALDKARSAFSGLSDDAKSAWSFIQTLGKKVDLVEFVKSPLKYATEIFKSAIEPFFKGRLDTIMGGIFQANAFATGGMVGGTGYGDTVPAMLTPGEFVMKRSAVDSIGAGVLSQMNRTGQAPQMQAGDVNVTLNIKTEQPIDEGFVRRTLVPTVKDEMRKASLRGEFIISARGVRA